MSDWAPAAERLAPDQAVARVCDWWGESTQTKGHLAVVGLDGGGAAVLEEVRRQIPASVVVDATGADAEGVLRRALELLGVPDDAIRPYAWDGAAFEHGAGKLVLIAHTGRAGLTRRSAQPLLVLDHVARTLACEGPSVVLDTLPSVMERSPVDRPCVRLDGTSSGVGAAASRSLSKGVRSGPWRSTTRTSWQLRASPSTK
ncbi:hypothetical protein ACFW6M_31160 [Streptomyces nigra]|uniref:hypothetical protein n=1 Tax=Streptomyces nigra TaxID=1827580 RepID=UPI0036C058A4